MDASKCLLLLVLAVAVAAAFDLDEPLEKDEIIDAVNNGHSTWVAGRNFEPSLTKRYLKNLLGLVKNPNGTVLPKYVDKGEVFKVPDTFDAREKWPQCESLQTIRDQGPCGSCWAVSAVSTFNDRICIAGQYSGYLSAEDLLTCCCCCAVSCGEGCKGGYDDRAWEFMVLNGVVTGGDFNSKVGCQPYKLPTCEHHVPGKRKNCSSFGDVPTPKCHDKCYNKHYKNNTYSDDKHKVTSAVVMINNTAAVQHDIYKHGPMQASFSVYEDFLCYKSGVYQHKTGNFVGGHAVKIIGWGTEDGTPYWLVANSWNYDWGDNGYFKILRGRNECNFEMEVIGGYID